ncbi:golgin subfamily A member 6C-like [Anneissia japonica]|uniref:golgin subfamily A member 6C-like n=1 Tax=Anneissia japonica TaxID=1529436 RepID=UPI001425899E|nr:golgin subfamily A member 6C-like [Anneissia japonica]
MEQKIFVDMDELKKNVHELKENEKMERNPGGDDIKEVKVTLEEEPRKSHFEEEPLRWDGNRRISQRNQNDNQFKLILERIESEKLVLQTKVQEQKELIKTLQNDRKKMQQKLSENNEKLKKLNDDENEFIKCQVNEIEEREKVISKINEENLCLQKKIKECEKLLRDKNWEINNMNIKLSKIQNRYTNEENFDRSAEGKQKDNEDLGALRFNKELNEDEILGDNEEKDKQLLQEKYTLAVYIQELKKNIRKKNKMITCGVTVIILMTVCMFIMILFLLYIALHYY